MSILFCDLVGSTALGERLDPEAFRRVQLRYYAMCETALYRHGGTIEKFIGDAVLCVFGIPTAREDDALRACRAGLDLIVGVEELNVELEREWGVELAVRIGVNSGVVVSGDSYGQTIVTGDTVNTAARLEQTAGAGEILIGAVTRDLIGDSATCIPVEPLELKGKGDYVPAWRLIAVEARTRQTAAPIMELPIVGRHDELEQLASWLEKPRGGLCLVAGPPGIGKSRLVAAAVAALPGPVVLGHCAPYGEGIAYAPLADWLDALSARAPETSISAIKFAVGEIDAPATAAAIQAATCSLARAVAAEQPLLLILEDAQWAEPAMLELAALLAREPDVRVLACARQDAIDVQPDLLLQLRPLDSTQAMTLLEQISPALNSADRVRLLEVAEGNPLVLGQLARHLQEGGDPDALPASLDALLQARIEGLSPEERGVAERASVMGREFWDSGVASLAPDAAPPTAAIALLTARGFVAAGRADGAREAISPTLSRVFSADAHAFAFTSSLLRDALYQATPKLRRADLHERLAGLLEAADAPDEPVAFHLERAAQLRAELRPREAEKLAARAAEHLERASERALQRHDGQAARALLTRAAALVGDGSAIRRRLEASLESVGRQTVAEFVPGDVIGKYRVRAIAGRGGMGVVYRADDLELSRQVALKVIAPQYAADAHFRERFARESRIAAGLEHPNVVPVYAAGEHNGQLFIAMRFVEGTDLQTLLRTESLLPERALALVAQVADALDAAHARGLVHRDVKPANVLVTHAGRAEHAYLTDFGLTRDASAGDGLTKTGQWVGTLAYVAPEQIRGEHVDARADIYALGALLYQCLTGSVPFPVESELEALAAHLDEPPPKPSAHGLPRAFDAVIERGLGKEPSKRFHSAGDLARAGVAAAHGTRPRLTEKTVATGAAAPVDDGRHRHRRSQRMTVLIAAAAALAAAALALTVAAVAGVFSGSSGPTNPAGAVSGPPIVLPHQPTGIGAGHGRVWLLSDELNQMMRVNESTRAVATFAGGVDLGGGSFPALAVGADAVWLAHDSGQVGGVDRIDPATGDAVQHVTFPLTNAVAVGPDSVWAIALSRQTPKATGLLGHIDPTTNRLTGKRVTVGRSPAAVMVADGSVWVANQADDSVWRVDPNTRTVIAKIHVGAQPSLLAASAGRVWVANTGDDTLMHIDTSANRVEGAPVSLGKQIQQLVASADAVWVGAADGTVTRLDPQSGSTVGSPIAPAPAPFFLATEGGTLWVASNTNRTLTRIQEGRK